MSRTRKPKTSDPKSSGPSAIPTSNSAEVRRATPNRLRIIAGRWRGVPITFPPLAALRPSPDRVRETLFNWLQPAVDGARCLDLFAGSGALGIEALSRGASHVEFVESEPRIARHLEETLHRLGVERVGSAAKPGRAEPQVAAAPATGTMTVHVQIADAMRFLEGPPRRFEIVFLDPPYASGLLPAICAKLAARGWLADSAFIYLECPADQSLPALPAHWSVHRTKRAGQVGYHLLRSVLA